MSRFRPLLPFLVAALNAAAAPLPLIPRELFLAAPERTAPLVSPDGARLVWLATTNGLPGLFVRPLGGGEGDRLAMIARRPMSDFRWTPNSEGLLFTQETEDDVPHVFLIELGGGNVRDLTPFTGVSARLLEVNLNVPDFVLAALNLRDRRRIDPFVVNLPTGALEPAGDNLGGFTDWHADARFRLRMALAPLPGGTNELRFRPDEAGLWRPFLRWGPEETTRFIGFAPDDESAWVVSTAGTNALRLLQIKFDHSEVRALAQDPRFDVTRVLQRPATNVLEAVQFERARAEWQALDPDLGPDLEFLKQSTRGDFDVLTRTADNRQWIVAHLRDDEPPSYHLYDRTGRRLTPLFSTRPRLVGQPLASTRVVEFAARDGLPLVAYLTVPRNAEPRALPLVLLVHPGPWARDRWGFDPEVQWLANRGYAVLQVNFRGSTGFGRAHLRAGFREWGGRMQDDLLDARQWAVDQGLADPARIAIMGAGYGGFAALTALTATPELFAAGVSVAGPVNLLAYLQGLPAPLAGLRTLLEERIGHPERDAEMLRARSPLTRADALRRPVFLAQAAGDPQIRTGETDEFIALARKNNVPAEYLVFPDEAQGVLLPANRRRLHAAVEAFLAQHLGGRAEPPAPAEEWAKLKR
ncbi:MAG: S9 family peptidase [Limisphaerales bacterium]